VILVGARLLVMLVRSLRITHQVPVDEILGSAAVLIVSGLVVVMWVNIVTVDRVSTAIAFSSLYQMKVKAVASFVVLSPLLAGVAISGPVLFRRHAGPAAILLLVAAGCVVAHTIFDIRFRSNEYKYMFTAAVCLAPFASIAWGEIAGRIGRAAWPVFAVIILFLAGTAFRPMLESVAGVADRFPRVEVDEFTFRLAHGERYAAVAEAILNQSPVDSVLLTGSVDRDLVAVTQRPLYVPHDGRIELPGIAFAADDLLIRTEGYDPAIVDRRRAAMHALYETESDSSRAMQLDAIQAEVSRPLVILLETVRDAGLSAWLAARPGTRLIYTGEGLAGWVVDGPAD
jgi:hypothetical protein